LINLSRYTLKALRKDQDFILYRGQSTLDLSRILVLAPAVERPGPESLRRLAHEYSLREELDPVWAARPIALAQHQGRTVLVLEDPGGTPLDQRLASPVELDSALGLAIGLATAIEHLHQRGIIHRDIKPANVLLDSATGQLRLMGFGIASRLPRERQSPAAPEFIAGTLPYMAPEQTGRMNRSIDSRSDLYSLGVTLYEIFTGTLPFSASDPMGWVHCHIAKQPQPPNRCTKEIPGTVSAIILKLLAKAAEERYQTAAGLAAELRRCLDEWESLKRIEMFTLGTHDTSDRLLMPEKLYGRDRENQMLLDSLNQVVATGKPILVLVSGYSGIGKSSIVNELHKAIVLPRGMFISGKFDQHKRDIPYGTLAQAFQSLICQILAKSDAEVDDWRRVLQEALGSNAQLIIGLIPELELVIGKQPPVVEIPQMEAENRFRSVFRSFLGAFARKEHPLALFLDDLQWADLGTLKLFEDLVTQTDVRHLLLVGAFRDNEVSPAHPLVRTLDAIRQSGAIVRDIVLGPLSLRDLIEFIADTLRCGQAAAEPLALLVHQKTLGNPFFAIQFLTALREERLLLFDARDGTWKWDLEAIHARGFTDNVVELMVSKLERLPIGTREALKLFACLGNSATTRILATVQEKSGEEVHSDLSEAARQGFVLPLDGSYKFLHDRVQEAAYSLIPEASRAEIHLRIGRILLSRMPPDEVCEKILDVVNQLNLGAALVTGWNEKEQIAKLNLRAGRTAKASAAYASACTYFSVAMALLGNEGWSRCYELAFSVYLERAECEFLSGNFSDAERFIENLLGQDAPKIDKAAVYRLKIDLHVVKSEMAPAANSCLDCLSLLGVEMSAHPTGTEVHAEYEKVWKNLDGRSIESLIQLPPMTKAEMQAAMRTLSLLFVPALLTDNNLLYLHLCKMVNLSVQYGTTDAAVAGYAWFGIILGPVFHRYEDGYLFGRLACDLVEKFGFAAYRAKANFAMEITVLWTKPVTTAIEYIQSAFRAAVEAGDLTVACYSRNHLITDLLLKGAPLEEVWLESERCLDFARKARFRDNVDVIVSQQRFILNMAGKTSNFSTFSDLHFDEAEFEAQLTDDRMSIMICWYWIMKLKARFLSGDYETAVAASRSAKELLCYSVGHIQLLDYYYYAALSVAALYNTASPDSQKEFHDLLVAHVAQLREWAENGSATFRDKFALVSAELARIEHRDLEAMSLYEQAIDSARENGFVQNEGIAGELAAAFYAARGFNKIAVTYLRDARHCYLRWGAEGKVRQLDELHPQLREEPAPSHPSTTIGAPVAHLDLATVIKVSQAISGEIVPENLIDTLMRTAIEHAGAEQGVLILLRDAQPLIEAEARTDRDEVTVQFRRSLASSSDLPISLLRYVIRTKESVTLSDASAENLFSEDEYFRRKSPRSVLCLPLVKQRQLTGILYFENNLAPGVFTPNRLATLELIASQAAISLEQARLYAELRHANEELQAEISERKLAEEALEKRSNELRKSEQRLQDIVDNTTAVVFVKDLDLHYLLVNSEYERRFHVQRDQIVGKTDFDIFPHDVAEVVRAADRKVIEAGAPIQFDEYAVPSDGTLHYYVIAKFLLRDSAGKPYAICGIATDITALKHAKELETKMAREREMFAQERAAQLAKANEALRTFLDALAAVPELDRFLGQVMAAITRQLGAASSTLRLHHIKTNTWELEHVFQNGRVMSPEEAQYPESFRSHCETQTSPYLQAIQVHRMGEPQAEFPDEQRLYLLAVGVKTLLSIPLVSLDKPIGLLGFRFSEDREFRPEELEIARALATQASLAIELTRLAEAARQSAVLQERNRLAGEIHDSLAQSFTGISMQLGMAREVLLNKEDNGLSYIERANDLARFGLAEARRSTLSLQPMAFQDPGLIDALRMLVERSNIPGRLRCTFRSNLVQDDSLSTAVRQDLLRIAQEAISNAMRHASATTISVTLRSDPPNLILGVRDNGSGMAGEARSSEGFGLGSVRARVKTLNGSLRIQTARGTGTRIIVSVPTN
jgi:PAS domain S-box-containing protein